ncbi:M81 family metallopeptidase [Undibacterium sp.]|jgi:microcystin degradation protein MlrC|uniref:M81 family metallopeptidase n=1 Tax=Undibacterium sp. TaxID=1914977 RepID=UPI002C370611|nr:M81 family metallopeptidase [Undibacterium sp.]HTD05670.1 M81 family metallopeptidase [Undibacterium sp.]
MKFFTAFLATETNTFAPAPTGWGAFQQYGIFHGDASTRDAHGYGMFAAELGRRLAAEGHELVESLTAFAQPFGRTVREVYESLRDEILSDLVAAGPVDGVFLMLHGAMVADGYDDCEGDLLARVREIVGPTVPVGVELDLHCHFTQQMQDSADAIICFKEYPHTDALLRMEELVRIVLDTAQGRLRPTTAVFDCKMVGMWHTTQEPMAGFVRRMQECERQPGVLSVSLGHGFPRADVAEAGAKLWVITDNDPALAKTLAEDLAREFWELRHRTTASVLSVEAALSEASALQDGPVVLADVADNPGGGATGDSTFILAAILEQGIADVAIGAFWDLGAIRICCDAGVGACIDLRLGGKCGPASGDPVDVRVTVKAIDDDFSQAGLSASRTALGPSVWVQTEGGLDIVLISKRSQVFSPDLFTGLGIDLSVKKLIVVKSSQHFHALFAPLAKAILYVSSPGAISNDFARLPYRVRSLDYWPRVENPHPPSFSSSPSGKAIDCPMTQGSH